MKRQVVRGRHPVRIGALLPLLLAFWVPGTASVEGQSLLSSSGLGIVAEPLDARARALGGVGVGSSGWSLQATDPAAAAGLTLPSIVATFSPTRATLTDGQTAGQARFPSIGLAYLLRSNVFSLSVGSAFDQRWEVVTERTIELGEMEVPAIDRYFSVGSVSRVQVGWSRRIGEFFAVGVTAGSFIGSVERAFTRSLDPAVAGGGIETFLTQGRWRASGRVASGGLAWDPSPLLRVSGALAWSGDLRFTPSTSQNLEESRYPIPVEFRLGGTATLTPGLALSVGATYADWGEVGATLGPETTRDGSWSIGGGVEWDRAMLLGRPLPFRIGARHQQLPFHFRGEPASERVFAGGAGWDLAVSDGLPLARIDLGVERGSRSAGDLSERFLRTTVTLRISGG